MTSDEYSDDELQAACVNVPKHMCNNDIACAFHSSCHVAVDYIHSLEESV